MKYTMLGLMCCVVGVSCSRSAEPTHNVVAPAAATNAREFSFDTDAIDKTPGGFTTALTGYGEPVQWLVQQVEDAPSGRRIVAQLSRDRTSSRYPNLVRDDFIARDVDLSVKFKTISGSVDASGGLIFRYYDRDNFYVVRANSLENNVVAYKTEKGQRSSIGVKGKGNAYGVKAITEQQKWHTLRVIMTGNIMEIFLNERKLFEVENDTFVDAGKIGLWTKADAVTQFDDLRVLSLDPALK